MRPWPRRVLFVGHTYVVGMNQRKLDALAETGDVEVGLLVPSSWTSAHIERKYVLETPYTRIQVFPSRVRAEGRNGAYFFQGRSVRRTLARFRPDLIHVEQEAFSMSAFQMAVHARQRGIPLTVFCWENVDRRFSSVRRATRRFVLRTARLAVAGNREAADLLRRWGFPGPIEVIPQLGVDPLPGAPGPPPVPDAPFVIGYVGRLVPEKGVDLVLQASARLRARGHRIKVLILGAGPEETRLRAMCAELGLSSAVSWSGTVRHEKVPGAMAALHALVLPSRRAPCWKEQFGHVLIEAMAMRIPVVGSDSGEIPRVIGRGDLVFPEGDAEALAEVLERLIFQPAWREEVARWGLERVRGEFTNERIAQRLLQAWKAVPARGAEV